MSALRAPSLENPQASPRTRCEIRSSLTIEELVTLLKQAVESFKPDSEVFSPESQQPAINPNFFSDDFSPQKDRLYYIQPSLGHRKATDTPNILVRADILSLLHSIQEDLAKGEFGDISSLDEGQKKLLDKIKNGEISNTKATVQVVVEKLLSIAETLLPREEPEDKESSQAVQTILPERLTQLAALSFSITVSWEHTLNLAQNLRTTEIGAEAVVVTPEKTAVQLNPVRSYLNDWLKELYSEDTGKILARKKLTLPPPAAFITSDSFFAYFDIKEVNKTDHDIADFILKNIKEVVEEFLKIPPPQAGPSYTTESTEEGESSQTELTQKVTTENDFENLIAKFSNAHASYSAETARLTIILFPQFFRLHGIELSLAQLEALDPITFLKLRREFQLELENVLRSLTPAEFALLKDGKFLQFRMLVLRRLYTKLATNPKFLAELLNYKQIYLKSIPEEQRTIFQKTANVTPTVFDKKLELEEKDKPADRDWTQTLNIQSFGDLSQATRSDFQVFFKQLLKDPKADYQSIFLRLDTLIAERWSPDKVRFLQEPSVFYAVFGFALPTSLAGPDNQVRLNQFLNLSAEYMSVRARRLAEHYQIDAIRRPTKDVTRAVATIGPNDPGQPVSSAQQIQVATSQAPTKKELESLAKAVTTVAEHKDKGGAEVLVVARASTRGRVREMVAGEHPLAAQVKKLHDKVEEERIDGGKRFLREMSLIERQLFLEANGLLPTDTAEETSELHVKRAEITSLSEHSNYVAGTSLLEEEDGLVEENPLEQRQGTAPEPQRYGRGDQARSLMREPLHVRRSPLDRKKRPGTLKKATDAVKNKVLEGAESAITSAVLGPLAAVIPNKTLRRGILAGIGGFAAYTLGKIATSVGAQVGAALGALGGGIAGTIVPIPGVGPAFGAFWGGVGGAHAGYALEAAARSLAAGSGATPTTAFTPSLPPIKLAATEASKLPSLANLSPEVGGKAIEVARGIGKNLFGPYVGPAMLTGGVVASALITNSALLSGFGPPPMATYDGNDGVSEFVSLTKEVQPGLNFNSPDGVSLTYTLKVRAKDSRLEITDLTDRMEVQINTDLNTETNIPIPEPNPPLNFEPLKTNGRIILEPNQEITVATYKIDVDNRYQHTNLTNTFSIKFDAITNGTTEVDQTANTTETICFGECPKGQEAAWPVTGIIRQGPLGVPSDVPVNTHSAVQAIDFFPLAGRELDTKAYATFAGCATAYPQGTGWSCRGADSACYGNHVVIEADNGLILGYAHLASFSSNIPVGAGAGTCVRVAPGDEVGTVGNTGMGATHLHYEVRGGRMIDIVPGNRIELGPVDTIYD